MSPTSVHQLSKLTETLTEKERQRAALDKEIAALRESIVAAYTEAQRYLARFKRVSTTMRLTKTEQPVFDMIIQGLSNKDIASAMGVSERTAKFHVSNVLAKHHCHRRAELFAVRAGQEIANN